MKLNVYKSQNEIEKTFEVDAYDLMYGTIEDIFEILDGAEGKNNRELLQLIRENRGKINRLILDVFPEMTEEDLRKIKLKELVPFFVELFVYVGGSFSDQKN
jgi:hypothetical protein